MRLSTRSRYGTRLMVELASHYNQGPIQTNDISKRQNISVKYLEQIIIPLKKAKLIQSVRGPKGGHMLAKKPDDIYIGQIVRILEPDHNLSRCLENPELCDQADKCMTRNVWELATKSVYETLDSISLTNILDRTFCI